MHQYKYTIHLRIKQQATGQQQTIEVPGNIDSDRKLKIDLQKVLTKINAFIAKLQQDNMAEYDPRKQFYSIFIRTDTGFVHIYKVMRNSQFKVYYETSDSQQKIFLDIRLQPFRQNSDKKSQHCVLTSHKKRIQTIQSKVLKLKNKLLDDFNKMSDQSKRPYDLVYLFSQPLVRSKGDQAKTEVSFVKEYQNFIKVFKGEAPARHVRVKMMVATQENIKKVLNEGVNILHFSSHGSQDQLHLQRNLGYQWNIDSQYLANMIQNAVQKPSLIVFNACYSRTIANNIFQRFKKDGIATIGYQGQAPDQYCEIFTQNFYSQAFKDESKSIQLIVEQIKWKMYKINPMQSKKLNLFISEKHNEPVFKGFGLQFRAQGSLQYDQLFSLGSNEEPLGIKMQLHKLIRILSKKQKEIFFLTGQPTLGKTTLIQKAVRYMRQRQVIDDFFEVNFKFQAKQIHSVLMFDIHFRDQVEAWIKQNQKKRKHNLIIVLDHCDQLMEFQTFSFLQYIRKSFFKNLKGNSKIVIVSNQVYHVNNSHFKEISTIIKKQPFLPSLLPFRRFIKKWNQKLLEFLKNHYTMDQNQKFWKQVRLLCTNPCVLAQTFVSFDTPKEVIQHLQILKKYESKQQHRKCISLQSRANHLTGILDQTNKLLKSFIYSGRYKHGEKYFLTVSFLDLFDSVEIIELQLHQFEQQWNNLKEVSKRIRQDLQAQNNSVKVYSFIDVCLGLIIRIPNFAFILNRWTELHNQILTSLTIVERIQYKFAELIENDSQLKNRIRCTKLRLLIAAKCLVEVSREKPQLFIEQQKQNFGRCIMRQIERAQTAKFEGQDQMQAIRTALQLNSIILQTEHYLDKGIGDQLSIVEEEQQIQQEDQYDQNRLNKSYYELNSEFEKYYKMVQILQKYHSSSRSQIKFCTQVQLSVVYAIGIRFIQVLLKQIYDKNIHIKMETIREKIQRIGDILTNFFSKRLRQAKDKSFSDLYVKYTRCYVKCRFKLQEIYVRQQSSSSFPLRVYQQLKKRCRQVKASDFMKEIQTHMMQNFSNICATLISQPLSYTKKMKDFMSLHHLSSKNSESANKGLSKTSYINLIRNECEVQALIKNTFNGIKKQVYIKILNLTFQNLSQFEQNTPLIYTMICECREIIENNIKRRVIFIQDYQYQFGSSRERSLDSISFPVAPVVIACGTNAKFIHQSYRNQQALNSIKSAFICFNQRQYNYARKDSFQTLIQQHYKTFIRKKIANFIFATFYKSFCSNFFNDNHQNFKKQVINSFGIAKLKARIQTKIKFYKDDLTNQIINQLIENLLLDITGIDQRQVAVKMKNGKCIYHPSLRQKILPQKVLHGISEIGFNQALQQCLYRIFKSKQQNIFIRSDTPNQTLSFLTMLIFKINKFQRFSGEVHYLNKANCTEVMENQFQQEFLVKRDSFDRQNIGDNQQFEKKVFIYDQVDANFALQHLDKFDLDNQNKTFLFVLPRDQIVKVSLHARDAIDIQAFFIQGKSQGTCVNNQICVNIVKEIYERIEISSKLNINSVLRDQLLIKNIKNFKNRSEIRPTIQAKLKKMQSIK